MTALDFHLTSAQVSDNGFIVTLGGEVDLHTAPQLDQRLRDLLDSGARSIVVDLTTGSFIDSTVLGVLLKTLRALDASGGLLVLVTDDLRVLRTFEVAGLNRVFRILPTLSEALALVAGGGAGV